jgi:hypothetical protein
VIAIGRLCASSRLGCIAGAAAAAALPFAHWTGSITKNDYPLAFFELAALYSVLRARQESDKSPWLLLTAFFIGLSLGVKHVALFAVIPLGLLALGPWRRSPRRARLAVSMGLIVAGSGLFWHARTFLLTGSPIYPAPARQISHAVPALDGTRPSRWTAPVLYPWWAHFDGHKVMESPSANPLGFYFAFFAPVWLLARRRERSIAERSFLFFLLVYYLYWGYIGGVLRYALAPILVLAVLTGERLVVVARQGSRPAHWTSGVVMGYCLAFAWLPTLILEVNAYQFPYFARRLDGAGYLRSVMDSYAAIEFLNRETRNGEQTLSINNCASAYANDPARFRCVRFLGPFVPETVARIAGIVSAARPDYVVLPAGERGRQLLPALQELGYGDPIFRDAAFQVIRLKRSSASLQPAAPPAKIPPSDFSATGLPRLQLDKTESFLAF